ncbi:MAG: hypothetical protein WCC58_11635 [Burkholderiales bacterium]
MKTNEKQPQKDKTPSEIVNQSGFPLQIGIAHQVRQTKESHGWNVIYTEHSWTNSTNETSGFIDIVLENKQGNLVLVIECKRLLDSEWIFLNQGHEIKARNHAKVWITKGVQGNPSICDWNDFAIDPASPESDFCVVRGQDNNSRPMLERLAAGVISSIEGFAFEQLPLVGRTGRAKVIIFIPIIVTTAKLKICTFEPDKITLGDGTIKEEKLQEVPYIRFRKQLSTAHYHVNLDYSHSDQASAKERTVFVVNAEKLIEFLGLVDASNSIDSI